jgi:hypothetical protein
MRMLIASMILILTGCVIQQQPMTPEERLIAIEQQRANQEQIRAGLQMMQQGSQFPIHSCTTRQIGDVQHQVCN